MTTSHLEDRIAAAIGDPGGYAGKRRGPSWQRRDDAYAPTEETGPAWAARAVTASLNAAGALLPTDGRLATLLPGDENRPTTAVVVLDGPHAIFRFCVNMLSQQCDIHYVAKVVKRQPEKAAVDA